MTLPYRTGDSMAQVLLGLCEGHGVLCSSLILVRGTVPIFCCRDESLREATRKKKDLFWLIMASISLWWRRHGGAASLVLMRG